MPAKTFIEILGDQIRKDLLADLESTSQGEVTTSKASNTTPLWTVGRAFDSTYSFIHPDIEDFFAKNVGKGKNPYRKATSDDRSTKSKAPSEDAKTVSTVQHAPSSEIANEPSLQYSALSPEAILACEFFARQSRPLKTPLTLSHLKTTFRQLALELHPDRFANQDTRLQKKKSELFQSLRSSYDTLKEELRQKL